MTSIIKGNAAGETNSYSGKNILMTAAAAAAAACVLLSGCAGAQPQTATLKLSANPTTGYEWEAVQNPELFEITSEYTPDTEDATVAGAGGTEVFTLKPLKKGTAEVSFSYARPWEEEAASVITYSLKVSGSMKISVESARASLEGDVDSAPVMPEFIIE